MEIYTEEQLESAKRPGFERDLADLVGYKPNSWQKIVHESDARFKVICAGRRSGKSHYVAYDTKDGIAVDLMLPGRKVWIVAPNYDLTQRVWDEVYTMAISKFKHVSSGGIISRIHNTKGNFMIETVMGTTIEAKSADEPEKLVGAGLTKIIIDEAALVHKKAWNQSLRPTLMDHHGKAMFISTPKGKNWFWELWMKGQENSFLDWQSWKFSSYDNEYLDRKEIDEIVKDMPEYEYRQEILATFEENAEQIFRGINEAAIGKYEEYAKGHRYQMGVDLGRKTASTVITIIDESVYPFSLVYFERFKIIDWALQVQRIKTAYEKYHCYRVRVDSTGIGDPITEDLERKHKVRVEPFIYKETSKKQLIDKLSIFIQDSRLIYPNEKQLLNELETFGREISPSGHVKYKAMGKHSDDCVNSLALACWGLPERKKDKKREIEKTTNKPISIITGY